MNCPFCDGPTATDPLLPGVLVCANPGCEAGPVLYRSVTTTAAYPAAAPCLDAAFEEASPHLAGLLADSVVKVQSPGLFPPV